MPLLVLLQSDGEGSLVGISEENGISLLKSKERTKLRKPPTSGRASRIPAPPWGLSEADCRLSDFPPVTVSPAQTSEEIRCSL